jgi:hypothetical protein
MTLDEIREILMRIADHDRDPRMRLFDKDSCDFIHEICDIAHEALSRIQ